MEISSAKSLNLLINTGRCEVWETDTPNRAKSPRYSILKKKVGSALPLQKKGQAQRACPNSLVGLVIV
jgi:hypothetical protein